MVSLQHNLIDNANRTHQHDCGSNQRLSVCGSVPLLGLAVVAFDHFFFQILNKIWEVCLLQMAFLCAILRFILFQVQVSSLGCFCYWHENVVGDSVAR